MDWASGFWAATARLSTWREPRIWGPGNPRKRCDIFRRRQTGRGARRLREILLTKTTWPIGLIACAAGEFQTRRWRRGTGQRLLYIWRIWLTAGRNGLHWNWRERFVRRSCRASLLLICDPRKTAQPGLAMPPESKANSTAAADSCAECLPC